MAERPTALTPPEQEIVDGACMGYERELVAIIRRLDDLLMATQRAAVERCTALNARVRELGPEAEPTNEWWNKRCGWYQGEIGRLDAQVARLREALRRSGERLHSASSGQGHHRYHTFEATDTVSECPEWQCVEVRAALRDAEETT